MACLQKKACICTPARSQPMPRICTPSARTMRATSWNPAARQIVPRATPEEEAEIEAMKRAAESTSPLESEAVGTVIKVAAVGVVVAALAGVFKLAQPVVENTIAVFPINSTEAPRE